MGAIEEIYEKYKHLDGPLSDLSELQDARLQILADLWMAIKEEVRLRGNMEK